MAANRKIVGFTPLRILRDTVSLDDLRDMIAKALTLATGETRHPQAWPWLTQYLVGKPEAKAPTRSTVVVQQWSGESHVVEKLARADHSIGSVSR